MRREAWLSRVTLSAPGPGAGRCRFCGIFREPACHRTIRTGLRTFTQLNEIWKHFWMVEHASGRSQRSKTDERYPCNSPKLVRNEYGAVFARQWYVLTGFTDEISSSLWANIFLCASLNSSISCKGMTNDQRFCQRLCYRTATATYRMFVRWKL